jgi:hypothetical protein
VFAFVLVMAIFLWGTDKTSNSCCTTSFWAWKIMSENVKTTLRRGPEQDAGAAPISVPVSNKRWYVVHAYSGMEKACSALTERIERAGMQDQFGQILVPTEEVVEVRNGQKSVTERRFFPGYVLVEMEMTDDTWHLVKNTSKVTGFIGGKSNKPPDSCARSTRSCSRCRKALRSHGRKCCTKWASKSASRKVRSPTSTAMSRSQLREIESARLGHHFWPRNASRAGIRPGRKSLNTVRQNGRRCQNPSQSGKRGAPPCNCAWWGATTHIQDRSHHGKENHWFYQAASASW